MVQDVHVLIEKFGKSLPEVSSILKTQNYSCEKKAILTRGEIDYEKFRESVLKIGVGKSAVQLWYDVLFVYFQDMIVRTVSSQLKLKRDYVATSDVLPEVFINVANMVSQYRSFTNPDLLAVVQQSSRLVARNYEVRIKNSSSKRGSYGGKIRSGEVNDVLVSAAELMDNSENEIEEQVRALKAIEGASFKTLLHDIFKVTNLFSFNTQDLSIKPYNLYGCFIRQFADGFVKGINERIAPYVTVIIDNTSSNDTVRKYKKYDELMSHLLPYIISDTGAIGSDNLNSVALFVCDFLFTQDNSQSTFFSQYVKLTKEELNKWRGNFSLAKRFKSPIHAEQFTEYMVGILALRKLYKCLSDVGVSPFSIDADVFRYEDPHTKFDSLYDLVRYSKSYSNLRRIHFGDRRSGSVVNLEILDEKINNPFVRRQAVRTAEIVSRVSRVLRESWGTMVIETDTEMEQIQLQKVLYALDSGYHPFAPASTYYLNDDSQNDDEIYDDLDVLLNQPLDSLYLEEYTIDSLIAEVETFCPAMVDLLNDLFLFGITDKDNLTALLDIFELVEQLNIFIDELIEAPKVEYVSNIELAIKANNSPLAIKIKLVSPEASAEEKIAQVLEAISETEPGLITGNTSVASMRDVLNGDMFQSPELRSLVNNYRNAFLEIHQLFTLTAGVLDNMLESSTSPPIPGDKLVELRKTLTRDVNRTEFNAYRTSQGFAIDQEGYLRNRHDQYVTKAFGTQVGFLHSLGMFVLRDGSVRVWDNG